VLVPNLDSLSAAEPLIARTLCRPEYGTLYYLCWSLQGGPKN